MKTRILKTFKYGGLIPLAAMAIGCARETTVYSDPAAAAVTPQTTPVSTDGRTVLPVYMYDQSVNRGRVDLALDGSSASSTALRLDISPGVNPQGSFNGTGTGNRAILGIAAHNSALLSALNSVTFDTKIFVGTEAVSVSLIADLACDGSNVHVLTANGADLGSGTAKANGYTRYSAGTNESKWKVEGSAIMDGATTLVPSTSQAGTASLDALIAKFPNACLKNTAVSADSLPQGLVMAGVMLTLGSDSSVAMSGAFVNRISVGSTVYDKME
jgi:hypothetical protein